MASLLLFSYNFVTVIVFIFLNGFLWFSPQPNIPRAESGAILSTVKKAFGGSVPEDESRFV